MKGFDPLLLSDKNPYYRIAKIIVSQKKPFSLEEITAQICGTGIELSQNDVEELLDNYCQRGIICKQGYEYSVSVLYVN